jgi:NADP-dependent 3-hydroxy acid dehydrogenase YdfG
MMTGRSNEQGSITMTKTALIVGVGPGISAAFARALHRDGYRVALAARGTEKLAALTKETFMAVLKRGGGWDEGQKLAPACVAALSP